tara:strand:+ start:113 stop:529 length:417 start_codon:yes stop_codon:yes gene_type:complete
MATATEALQSLGITEWVLRGRPTKEEEFLSMFRKVTGATSDGRGIESDNPSEWGVTWKQVSDEMAKLEAAAPMVELRRQRDIKLAETDWYALSDVTMSDEMKTYRQTLRDLPAHSNGKNATLKDGVLGNVGWPEKPKS